MGENYDSARLFSLRKQSNGDLPVLAKSASCFPSSSAPQQTIKDNLGFPAIYVESW